MVSQADGEGLVILPSETQRPVRRRGASSWLSLSDRLDDSSELGVPPTRVCSTSPWPTRAFSWLIGCSGYGSFAPTDPHSQARRTTSLISAAGPALHLEPKEKAPAASWGAWKWPDVCRDGTGYRLVPLQGLTFPN